MAKKAVNTDRDLQEFLVAQFATFRAEYREDAQLLKADITRVHTRIDGVELAIKEVRDTGIRTELQTIKTNGRVTALENHTKNCPVPSMLEDIQQNQKDIVDIKATEKAKDSEEYKTGKLLKQIAIIAGYIVGIAAVFSGLIYLKDTL